MRLNSEDIAAPNRVTVKRLYTKKRKTSAIDIKGRPGKVVREKIEKDYNISAWAAILVGERPPLIWPFDCPVKKGDEIILSTSMIRDAGKINDFERDDELVWTQPIPSVTIVIGKLKIGANGETIAEGRGQGVIGYHVLESRPLYMQQTVGETRSTARAIDDEGEYAKEAAEEYAAQVEPINEARQQAKRKADDPQKQERRFKDFLHVVLKDLDSSSEQLALLDEFEKRLREIQGRSTTN